MKILVIQLTRFGDILCTLPALSALRREHADAEIHFMVRKKFSAAAENCRAVDHLWRFDSKKIIQPLIEGSQKLPDAILALNQFVAEMRKEKFDLIVNVSFSPSSSFIAHLISQNEIPVVGYTRTSDFYLRVPDLPSQYFRAQVGISKSSRLHVADLMGWIMGCPLLESDWGFNPYESDHRDGVVCHLGASQDHKMWPKESWIAFLSQLGRLSNQHITLVGSVDERNYAQEICDKVKVNEPGIHLFNKVGDTTFADLKELIASALIFVGGDSGPMHVASHTRTRVLNLSVGNVRFWETGPVSIGSRILVQGDPVLLGTDVVLKNALEMLEGKNSREGFIECVQTSRVGYLVHPNTVVKRDFWPLIDWLYFGGQRPVVGGEILTALNQICEVCELSLQQLETFHKNPSKVEAVGVLDRLDEILEMFRTHIAPLAPLMDSFQTQKENIPPGLREEIFYQTKNCYTDLHRRAAELARAEKMEVLENVKGLG